jgi:hypothetical protein
MEKRNMKFEKHKTLSMLAVMGTVLVATLMILPSGAVAWQYNEASIPNMASDAGEVYQYQINQGSYTIQTPAWANPSSGYVAMKNGVFQPATGYSEVHAHGGFYGGQGFVATESDYYTVMICWLVDYSVTLTPAFSFWAGSSVSQAKIWVESNLMDLTAGRPALSAYNQYVVLDKTQTFFPVNYDSSSQFLIMFDVTLIQGHTYTYASMLQTEAIGKGAGICGAGSIVDIASGSNHAQCFYMTASTP